MEGEKRVLTKQLRPARENLRCVEAEPVKDPFEPSFGRGCYETGGEIRDQRSTFQLRYKLSHLIVEVRYRDDTYNPNCSQLNVLLDGDTSNLSIVGYGSIPEERSDRTH